MKNTKDLNNSMEIGKLSHVNILNQLEIFIANLKMRNIPHRVITYKEYPVKVFFKPYDRWLLVSIAYRKIDIKTNCSFSFFAEEIYKGNYQFNNWYAFGEMSNLSINMLEEMQEKARTFSNYSAPINGNDFLLLKYIKKRYPNGTMVDCSNENLVSLN